MLFRSGIIKWLGTTIGTLAVLALLAVIIWKNRKILKGAILVSVFAICLIGNAHQVFGVAHNIAIKAVSPGSAKGIGTDGYYYYCSWPGKYFCDQWHDATLIDYSLSDSYETWNPINAPEITLTDKTDHEKVNYYSYDSEFNKIGPFKVNSSKKDVTYKIRLFYSTKTEDNKTVKITSSTRTQALGFDWNKNFYIKISKNFIFIDFFQF